MQKSPQAAMIASWMKLYLSGVLTLIIDRIVNGGLSYDWVTLRAILIAAAPPVLVVIKNYFDKGFPMYGPKPKDELIVPNPNAEPDQLSQSKNNPL